MRAVRLVHVGKPLEMQEIAIPDFGDREVLVRVRAAGICHSDAHYRAGRSPVYPLPLTLGHEVAGVVEAVGSKVERVKPGASVVLHYLVTCGNCEWCNRGNEQFCVNGKMLGHYTDGGYADYIAVPERNALILPDEVPYEAGATLMCASATAFHALRKSRLQGGERVAIFGTGGLGLSAVQLAKAMGALEVYAVDIQAERLEIAADYGAIPVLAGPADPVDEIRQMTGGRGVDVALEIVGKPLTMRQALRSLGALGRAVIVGLSDQEMTFYPYSELLGPEAELIGSNDHLLSELPLVLEYARRGNLDLSKVVGRSIALDADRINQTLDELESFKAPIRTVIVP